VSAISSSNCCVAAWMESSMSLLVGLVDLGIESNR
jgi:hypothetical protein